VPRAGEGQKLVFARLTGDWGRARSIFDGFAVRLNNVGERLSKDLAEATARRLRENIKNRNYERYTQGEGGGWPPLADGTVRRKEADGVASPDRPWVETEQLVNAIKAFHLGRGAWFVGVEPGMHGNRGGHSDHGDPIPLEAVAAMLEFGYSGEIARSHEDENGNTSVKAHTVNIPARPVFRIEAERMRGDPRVLGTIRNAYLAALFNTKAYLPTPANFTLDSFGVGEQRANTLPDFEGEE
jgi:hypothetical protein